MPVDLEGGFEVFGKSRNGVSDFLGLAGEGVQHGIAALGLAADHLHGGEHKGDVIVHVMTQIGEFLFQLTNLFHAERDGFGWQRHPPNFVQFGWKSSVQKQKAGENSPAFI